MTRGVGVLASLIAVIGGFSAGIVWLGHNVSSSVFGLISLFLYAGLWFVVAVSFPDYSVRPWMAATLIATGLVSGVLGGVAANQGLTGLYIYMSVWAVVALATAYLRDRQAHKRCPDCCETVLAKARVCRYCRWRFEEPVASGHPGEEPSRRGQDIASPPPG